MRRVSLLGAFEISAEVDAPVRDGLILGSRREQRGFVLDTSRENIEQIVSAASPPVKGAPLRLAQTLGKTLNDLGCTLLRVELKPLGVLLPMLEEEVDEEEEDLDEENYVQGFLVFRREKKVGRLKMTATEAIQIAIAEDIPMLAATDLLQLDVSQFLDEIDEFSDRYTQETNEFKSFVDNVKASDFSKYLRKQDNTENTENAENPENTENPSEDDSGEPS
ncbi:MAG: hypothetical protein ACM3YO_00100 [Bacteroidota bacterium]